MCQSGNCPPKPPEAPRAEYYILMNQIQTTAFFRALHAAEDVHIANVIELGVDPDYLEGYDYVMDMVKDVIMSGEVEDLNALDEFVNQADAYAEDESGEYGKGYQDAVNVCLEALSTLLGDDEDEDVMGDYNHL
jgi:hypothetical protein